MNQKGFIKDIVIIVLGIIVLGGGYFYFSKNPAYAPSENSNTNQEVADETADWKTSIYEEYGLEFKHPSHWNSESGNSPYMSVSAGNISDVSTICGEMGGCQGDLIDLRQSIVDKTAQGLLYLDNVQGSLVVSCSPGEGWYSKPAPSYSFNFFRGDKWITLDLTDLSTDISGRGSCFESSYLKKINAPQKINDEKYEAYNNFITLIEETLIIYP